MRNVESMYGTDVDTRINLLTRYTVTLARCSQAISTRRTCVSPEASGARTWLNTGGTEAQVSQSGNSWVIPGSQKTLSATHDGLPVSQERHRAVQAYALFYNPTARAGQLTGKDASPASAPAFVRRSPSASPGPCPQACGPGSARRGSRRWKAWRSSPAAPPRTCGEKEAQRRNTRR